MSMQTVLGLILNLVIAAPFAAVFLRAAISLSNRFLDESGSEAQLQEIAVLESSNPVDDSNPYSTPAVVTAAADAGGVIPEPSFGRAYVICLVQAVGSLVVSFLLGLSTAILLDRGVAVRSAVFVGLFVSVPVYAGILVMMLPTTISRALLILVCQFLIGISLAPAFYGVYLLLG